MFDVSWTDPSRETVGQRKNRREQQSNGLSRGSSVRSSGSSASRASKASDSSPAQPRPSLFGFLGGNKKSALARSGSQVRPSALSNDKSVKESRRVSSYNVMPESQSPQTLPTKTRIQSNEFGNQYQADTDVSGPSDESVFSGWTGRSNNTDSSWSSVADPPSAKGSIIQPLSRTSFVTQSTEVTVSSRDSVKISEQLATIVHISAAGTMPIHIRDSQSKQSSAMETFDFPVPKSHLPEKAPKHVLRENISLSPEGWPVTTKGKQQESWRPPDAWECQSEEKLPPKPSKRAPDAPSRRVKNRKPVPPPTELTHLRKNLRRMEAASPKIVVERLKEEWVEIADAAVYRELELEKKLWMLSALRRIETKPINPENAVIAKPLSASAKILSLYENHGDMQSIFDGVKVGLTHRSTASASFLAAHSPAPTIIHHLSPNPLCPNLYPNVHPLTIPSPSTSLPYASSLFTSIHSLYYPAFLPGSSLPTLLKDCHRCLTTSGTLHLTILDPSPLPTTLGPLLREWLDSHLLINLERQFRCINPSRLFPIWLADAGLRAEGSTITIERFLGSVSSSSSETTSSSSSQDSVGGSTMTRGEEEEREREMRQQLKSQVGRMLWKEMWGGFVEGEKWWWEDEGVVEECQRMGTGWEYAVIAAVKEG